MISSLAVSGSRTKVYGVVAGKPVVAATVMEVTTLLMPPDSVVGAATEE
jgi:hypothetical protein